MSVEDFVFGIDVKAVVASIISEVVVVVVVDIISDSTVAAILFVSVTIFIKDETIKRRKKEKN